MALTLIAPDVPRLAAFFLLGRLIWRRVEWTAVLVGKRGPVKR
jgi:hypothetical protein